MSAPEHDTWGWKWLALGLVVCVVLVRTWLIAMDRLRKATPRPVSPGAEALFRVVEDESLPLKQRGDAARELAEFPERGVVDRLCRLLPGGGDVLTFDVVNTLGEIGDPRALPTLERMTSGAWHGKINVALDWAIRRCKGKK